jgi:hypothetical protein
VRHAKEWPSSRDGDPEISAGIEWMWVSFWDLFLRLGYSLPERVVARTHVGQGRTVHDNPLGLGGTDAEQVLNSADTREEVQVPRSKQGEHGLEVFPFRQPLACLGDDLVVPAARHGLSMKTGSVLGKAFPDVAGGQRCPARATR